MNRQRAHAAPRSPPKPEAAAWARVEELFSAALERDPATRSLYLIEACADAPHLIREVQSLLEAHEGVGTLPHLHDDAATPAAPERIGPYQILAPLGHGGMGVVYLAEREGGDFTQRVALKVVAAGYLDRRIEERLRSERRILARLEHPYIARLIDGGVTADGRPFFAMEYVQGVNVVDHCAKRALSVSDRLRLFLDICEAVHYAHQQLIVHRDLKPSNILITQDGRPKLLDFGIARVLESSDRDDDRTRTAPWLTPAYASPEQVRGGAVSTLSDVYALGVLLYQLLAGRRPYETEGCSPAEVEHIVCERMPEPPSRAAPERLRRRLAGDLDTIVLKALAKEPGRRYTSAEQLADDLRRHLDGRPVLARPDRLSYRASKFVRRHRVAVIAVAAVVVSLATGLAVAITQARRATVQRVRAQTEAARASRVAAMMVEIFRLTDPNEALGDTITARQILDRGTERVERELAGQPDLQSDLLGEVARVYGNLGLLERAEQLARRALDLSEEAFGESSPEAGIRHAQLGGILAARGARGEAMASLRRAIAIREAAVTTPDSILAQAWSDLAWHLREEHRREEAIELFTKALDAQRALFGDYDAAIATTVLGLAASYHDAGRFDDAETLFQGVVNRAANLDRPHPLAATALLNVGMIKRLRGQYAQAEPLLRSGLEMRQALYEPDHPGVLEALVHWARELIDLGRLQDAKTLLEDALPRAMRVLGAEHPTTNSLRETSAALMLELGNFARAATLFDSTLAVTRANHPPGHAEIAVVMIRSAEPLVYLGRLQVARARYEEALAMTNERSVYRVLALHGLAHIAWRTRRDDDAMQLYDSALELATGGAGLAAAHRYVRALRRDRAAPLIDRGRAAEVEQELSAVDAAEDTIYPEPHHYRARTVTRLGEAQLARGDFTAAEATLRRALQHMERLPPTHWRAGEARALLGGAVFGQGRVAEASKHEADGLAIVRAHLGREALEARRLEARLRLLRDARGQDRAR